MQIIFQIHIAFDFRFLVPDHERNLIQILYNVMPLSIINEYLSQTLNLLSTGLSTTIVNKKTRLIENFNKASGYQIDGASFSPIPCLTPPTKHRIGSK